jgi:hypothetical protein
MDWKAWKRNFRIGEGPEYRPFGDLRSVPEACRVEFGL